MLYSVQKALLRSRINGLFLAAIVTAHDGSGRDPGLASLRRARWQSDSRDLGVAADLEAVRRDAMIERQRVAQIGRQRRSDRAHVSCGERVADTAGE
jgi:hypothetical protein